MERQLFADMLEPPNRSLSKRRLVLTVSLAIHVAGLLAVIMVPLLQAQPLPEPADAIKAFFIEPAPAPPPPPPPPPPAKAPPPRVAQAPSQELKFQVPKEVPHEINPPTGNVGSDDEVTVGINIGSIVDRLPAQPPPPPVVQTVRPGGNIKEPTKVRNVLPIYPDIAKQARVQGIVILECTISPQGHVTDVKVLRGIPLLDEAGMDAVKQWQYTPTLLNGVPVSVIMTVTVKFRLN